MMDMEKHDKAPEDQKSGKTVEGSSRTQGGEREPMQGARSKDPSEEEEAEIDK